jgi:hypothetical protein
MAAEEGRLHMARIIGEGLLRPNLSVRVVLGSNDSQMCMPANWSTNLQCKNTLLRNARATGLDTNHER